jgi:hypothetical protein
LSAKKDSITCWSILPCTLNGRRSNPGVNPEVI